ncbi:MAG: hypothetical protein QM679_01735 [Patulibacter sp.]
MVSLLPGLRRAWFQSGFCPVWWEFFRCEASESSARGFAVWVSRNGGASAWLTATATPGVYAFGPAFETLVERLQVLLSGIAPTADRVLRFSPLLSREHLERTGYLTNMPHLLGCVHAFQGDETDFGDLVSTVGEGGDWSAEVSPTALVLAPAVCFNVYPLLSGVTGSKAVVVDASGSCFRHESSAEPGRFQSFRMREFVCAGPPDAVVSWRQEWLERGRDLFTSLGIVPTEDVANDPFFANAHRIMKLAQQSERLKLELRVPLPGTGSGTVAAASFNYHKAHFSDAFAINPEAGWHTACVGFGLERIVLALLAEHGETVEAWPSGVAELLDVGCLTGASV